MTLLPQHQGLIDASGISAEVAKARGYRSAETKAELSRLGFTPRQRNVPALLISLHDVLGERAGYLDRPPALQYAEFGWLAHPLQAHNAPAASPGLEDASADPRGIQLTATIAVADRCSRRARKSARPHSRSTSRRAA